MWPFKRRQPARGPIIAPGAGELGAIYQTPGWGDDSSRRAFEDVLKGMAGVVEDSDDYVPVFRRALTAARQTFLTGKPTAKDMVREDVRDIANALADNIKAKGWPENFGEGWFRARLNGYILSDIDRGIAGTGTREPVSSGPGIRVPRGPLVSAYVFYVPADPNRPKMNRGHEHFADHISSRKYPTVHGLATALAAALNRAFIIEGESGRVVLLDVKGPQILELLAKKLDGGGPELTYPEMTTEFRDAIDKVIETGTDRSL